MGMYFCRSVYRRNFLVRIKSGSKKKMFFGQKASRLSFSMLDRTFYVYNGRRFVSVPVVAESVGKAIGEFCFTKRITGEIHVKNKKSRKKKVVQKKRR